METTRFAIETRTDRYEDRNGTEMHHNYSTEVLPEGTTLEEATEAMNDEPLEIGDQAELLKLELDEEENQELNNNGAPWEFRSCTQIDFREEKGEALNGAILLTQSWLQYVGYARKFHSLSYGSDHNEAWLKDGNEERTFKAFTTILITAQELEGLTDEDILEMVREELTGKRWKWEGFNDCPVSDEEIISALNLDVRVEKDEEELA